LAKRLAVAHSLEMLRRPNNVPGLGSGLNFLIRRSQLQILFLHERHELVEVLSTSAMFSLN
jgi:hypothetical protein